MQSLTILKIRPGFVRNLFQLSFNARGFGRYINESRVISLLKTFEFKYLLRIEHLRISTLSITASLPVSGTLPRSYDNGSFTWYVFNLHEFVYDPRETKIRMQIRTRDPDGGVLMFNAGSQEGRYSLLEVQGLCFLEFSNVYYFEINTRFGLSMQKYQEPMSRGMQLPYKCYGIFTDFL